MESIYELKNIYVPKDVNVLYDHAHHLRRLQLLEGMRQYSANPTDCPDYSGVKDYRIGNGAVYGELLPISNVDIMPDEPILQTSEIMNALNASNVMMLHLDTADANHLRSDFRQFCAELKSKRAWTVAPWSIALSYGELIDLTVRLGGMRPATVQSYSRYIRIACDDHWRRYSDKNYRTQLRKAKAVSTMKASFARTEDIARIG